MRIQPLAVVLSLLLLSLAAVSSPARAQDEAGQAWARGDVATAERLYSARLARDSADLVALHRVALIRAWNERYDESLHLFDRLLAFAPDNLEATVDRARVQAWKGDPRGGVEALDRLLARNPTYLPALQARAQFASWAGLYDESLATYGRILQISPGEAGVAYDRARVLSWASRFGQAAAVYDSLLRVNPNDRDALLGLGQVLAWGGKLDSAAVVYRRVLAADPGNLDARRGLARSHAWSGRLIRAEEEWRRVLSAKADDPSALVGLSQTLRWQGRDAAALDAAQRAVRAAPTDRDARAELRWAELPTRPRAAPSFTYESDSDGNRIATTTVSAGWRPSPRVEVRGEGYLRNADQQDVPAEFSARAQGAAVTLWTQVEPGWSFSGTAGVSTSDVDEADPVGMFRAAVSTPARHRATATLALSRQAVDGTALLVRRQVVGEDVSLSASFAPAQGWTLSGGAGGGALHRARLRREQHAVERQRRRGAPRLAALHAGGGGARVRVGEGPERRLLRPRLLRPGRADRAPAARHREVGGQRRGGPRLPAGPARRRPLGLVPRHGRAGVRLRTGPTARPLGRVRQLRAAVPLPRGRLGLHLPRLRRDGELGFLRVGS